MDYNQRLIKLATADSKTLERIDSILEGGDHTFQDEDLRTVTLTSAAQRLNVSRVTIYRLCKAGKIQRVALNGVSRIRLQSLIAYANGRAA